MHLAAAGKISENAYRIRWWRNDFIRAVEMHTEWKCLGKEDPGTLHKGAWKTQSLLQGFVCFVLFSLWKVFFPWFKSLSVSTKTGWLFGSQVLCNHVPIWASVHLSGPLARGFNWWERKIELWKYTRRYWIWFVFSTQLIKVLCFFVFFFICYCYCSLELLKLGSYLQVPWQHQKSKHLLCPFREFKLPYETVMVSGFGSKVYSPVLGGDQANPERGGGGGIVINEINSFSFPEAFRGAAQGGSHRQSSWVSAMCLPAVLI